MDATKIISLFLLLVFIFCLQNCAPKFVQVNSENYTTAQTADIFNDSVFNILNTKYDTVIGFSRYNENKNLSIQSYFLCFKKDYSIGYQNIYKLNPINH